MPQKYFNRNEEKIEIKGVIYVYTNTVTVQYICNKFIFIEI